MHGCETERSPHAAMHNGCCCGGSFHRHFITQEEEKQLLKDYSEQLKKEQEGIERRLKELEG
jgi:hypothetical protein